MNCPQCGAEHSEEQGRFCASCGLPVAEAPPLTCPHCGATFSPEQGRFCDACGMSVVGQIRRDGEAPAPARRAAAEGELPRCRACGTVTDAPICPGCGGRMPAPDQ